MTVVRGLKFCCRVLEPGGHSIMHQCAATVITATSLCRICVLPCIEVFSIDESALPEDRALDMLYTRLARILDAAFISWSFFLTV